MTTPEQAAAEAWRVNAVAKNPYADTQSFLSGVAWAREQYGWSESHNSRKLLERIAELEAQVANWERNEIRKASCCADNEMRVKELEAELKLNRDGFAYQIREANNCAGKWKAEATHLEAQLADLTGGLSVEEFKLVVLEMQKNQS